MAEKKVVVLRKLGDTVFVCVCARFGVIRLLILIW